MTFRDVAHLFLPADAPDRGRIIEAARDWRIPTFPRDAEVLVWGRAPTLPMGDPRDAALRAVARRRAVRLLRASPPHDHTVVHVHRWNPARIRPSALRHLVRSTFTAGAVIELRHTPPSGRVLDACAEAAGRQEAAALGTIRLVSAGAVNAHMRLGDRDAMFRAAKVGAGADPARGADALERLASAKVPHVPRLLGSGEVAGAAWSAETILRGRRPTRLTPTVTGQVVDVLTRLPRWNGPATSWREDLDRLQAIVPGVEAGATAARESLARLDGVPAVARHGDLWSGNLLQTRDRLTGIVDWDAFHPAGVPGTDLLHLLATESGLGESIGDTWRRRPWGSPKFLRVAEPYFATLGVSTSPELLDAVALAWWAGRVRQIVLGTPDWAADPSWLHGNVFSVLRSIDH